MNTSIILNKTYYYTIKNCSFGSLSSNLVYDIFKDGRAFSHFIEKWLEQEFPLTHISGCKTYDFIDKFHKDTKYDEKTFTKRGCCFKPSNMLGQGRKFDRDIFEEKTKSLIFCIVSNVDFPNIKVKFMTGEELLKLYPNGKIPLKDHIKFFG